MNVFIDAVDGENNGISISANSGQLKALFSIFIHSFSLFIINA